MSGKLKIGDEILILGDKTGLLRQKVERMEIENIPVKEALKSQEVGIKIPGARKKDKIYIIIKK